LQSKHSTTWGSSFLSFPLSFNRDPLEMLVYNSASTLESLFTLRLLQLHYGVLLWWHCSCWANDLIENSHCWFSISILLTFLQCLKLLRALNALLPHCHSPSSLSSHPTREATLNLELCTVICTSKIEVHVQRELGGVGPLTCWLPTCTPRPHQLLKKGSMTSSTVSRKDWTATVAS
jgi:hypothetical protein